jgi:hypothetical protein
MHDLSRKALRTWRPRYLRAVIDGDRESPGVYPTGMLSRIGAIILVALCVELAADFLTSALIR